jgi:hypothetical protein
MGVEVQQVERLDSGRLRLSGIRYSTDSLRCSVDKLELPSLHQYLWERFEGGFSDVSRVDAGALDIYLLPAVAINDEHADARPADVVSIVSDLHDTLRGLESWLPPLNLNDLIVRSTQSSVILSAHELSLEDCQLRAVFEQSQLLGSVLLQASLRPDTAWSFYLVHGNVDLELALSFESEETGLDVDFVLQCAEDLASGSVSFVVGERIPERATLKSKHLSISAEDLPILERFDLDTVNFSEVDFIWDEASYAGSLALEAMGARRESVSIPMTGELEISGDFECLRVKLSAKDLFYDPYSVARLDLLGEFQGSVFEIEQMFVQPLAADDGRLLLSGSVDLGNRDLDLDYQVSLASDWLNGLIVPLVVSNSLMTRGYIRGDFEHPLIVGELDPLIVEYAGVTPVTLSGAYRSDVWNRWNVTGTAAAAGAVIDASCIVGITDGVLSLDLNQFTWADPVRPTLNLQAPAHFSYQLAGEFEFPESRFTVQNFRLAGPALDIKINWDPILGLELRLHDVTLQRLAPWVERELPALTIESFELFISELRPLILGSLSLYLDTHALDELASLHLELEADLTPTGLQANAVQLQFVDATILQGQVVVPVIFQLPTTVKQSFWKLLPRGDLAAKLKGSVREDFSKWLFEHVGIQINRADLELNIAGDLEEPIGQLDLKVSSLETSIAGVPVMDQIEILAKAESDQIHVERFSFIVNQSEVSGDLSVSTNDLGRALSGGREELLAWLSGARGRLEFVDWQAEDWLDYLPPIMRRSGRVSGLLTLQPDWDLSGRVSFQQFALRPTESLPAIDLIQGEVDLHDRKFSVRSASAQVGGSPLVFAGWLDASDLKRPLWEFTVSGKNVPLVRTTDMILRSDLALTVSRSNAGETPIVQGDLGLRSSTMLVEFDPLAPNVASGPQLQPPYFSITEPTIADWRFDLHAEGDSFMRVRSPYFRTQLSASFDLSGSFEEPRLIGTVRTVDGELRFPGATMGITSGEAYIEPGRPNELQLNFSGIAQRASYTITMDVTQTLADPYIHFESTPTLSNASIIRLLTTGSTSGGGGGAVGLYLGQGLLGAGGMDEQFSDRLTVDVGEETSRRGRSTVGVRYNLSDDFFLEGGYDVYDAYNLDLIWSLFKR